MTTRIKHAAQRGVALARSLRNDPDFGPMARGLAKEASFWQGMAQTAASMALATGVVGVGNAALGAVSQAYNSLTEGRNKSRAFVNMVQSSPELSREDRSKVQRAFSTLWTASPETARDPLVASTFVRKAVEYNAVATDEVAKLVQMENTRAQTRVHKDPFRGPIGALGTAALPTLMGRMDPPTHNGSR